MHKTEHPSVCLVPLILLIIADKDVHENGNRAPPESIIPPYFRTNLRLFVLIISPITLLICASLGHSGLAFVFLTP